MLAISAAAVEILLAGGVEFVRVPLFRVLIESDKTEQVPVVVDKSKGEVVVVEQCVNDSEAVALAMMAI